jgi:type IV pilus assembly protein PilN
MIRINLLPPEYEAKQRSDEQRIIFGGFAGIVVFILGLFWWSQKMRANSLAEEVTKSEATLNEYKATIAQIEQIERDKGRLLKKRNVIRELNRSRLIYPVFFEDFLPIVPADVWLTNLNFSEQGDQIALDMNCGATSNFALATWLTNLQQSTHFSNVELGPISYTKSDTQGTTLSFNIKCSYRHQGAFPLSEYY